MKILVTGFDPFGGEAVNPSFEAVKLLPDQIGGAQIIKLEIPTVYPKSVQAVTAAVERFAPDAVVSVGQAGGRKCVTVEKVAINYADADIPDNDGLMLCGETLAEDGPAAYFATVPVKAMVQKVREGGFECKLSYSAGAYVCNCVMYNTLHLAACRCPRMQVGFVHVPYADEQLAGRETDQPSMPLAAIAQALGCALEAVTQNSLQG